MCWRFIGIGLKLYNPVHKKADSKQEPAFLFYYQRTYYN